MSDYELIWLIFHNRLGDDVAFVYDINRSGDIKEIGYNDYDTHFVFTFDENGNLCSISP